MELAKKDLNGWIWLKWPEMAGKGVKWGGLLQFLGFRDYGKSKLRDWRLGDFQLGPAKPGLLV